MTTCGSRWRARAPGRPWVLEHICAVIALEESGDPFPWSSFQAREGGQVWWEHITQHNTLVRTELQEGRGRSRLEAAWTRLATSGPLTWESAFIGNPGLSYREEPTSAMRSLLLSGLVDSPSGTAEMCYF